VHEINMDLHRLSKEITKSDDGENYGK